jgi:predicted DNA-binding transcriptional regulator AlpA
MKDTQQTFLPAKTFAPAYGVSDMSLWRWLRDVGLGFPQPLRINGRRFWKASQLEAWEASRPETQEAPNATS